MNEKVKDEIDLIELILIVFEHKWKIAVVTVLATILAFFYEKQYISSSEVLLEIKTISSVSELEYKAYNTYIGNVPDILKVFSKNVDGKNYSKRGSNSNSDLKSLMSTYGLDGLGQLSSFSIYKTSLISLFAREFDETDIVENVLKKYDLIFKKNYKNEQLEGDFKKSLSSFGISGIEVKNDKLYLRISFQDKDVKSVKIFLPYIEKYINDKVRLNLLNNFNAIVVTQKKLDKFKIEDLEIRANKIIEMNEIKTTRKLSFLLEQSQIARSLDIISNLKGDFPKNATSLYYMRGYEVIEKEIELIRIRTNSPENVFTKELEELKYKIRTLEKNLIIRRIEKIFKDTPISIEDNFYAARIISSTLPDSDSSGIKLMNILLTFILTLICMIIYVLILNGIRNRK